MKNYSATRHFFTSLCLLALFIVASQVKLFAADGDLDTSFNAGVTALVSTASIVVRQPTDGRILVGGTFTAANGRTYNQLVRLNADGTNDPNFDIGIGFNVGATVKALAVQGDGKILVGGIFTSFNGVARRALVRLNADGSLDTDFNMGGAGIASPGDVSVIALQSNNQILIGGGFTQYNGMMANQFARLNLNGSLDTTFAGNLGTGFNASPLSIAVQSDEKIVVGGSFSTVNSASSIRLVRLNANGTRDTAFTTNMGTSFGGGLVNTVALQDDEKILVGGAFTTFNGSTRTRIARLNADGTLDSNWADISASVPVTAIAIQPDGQFLVIGENNATFGSGLSLRRSIARLNELDGTIDTTFDPGTGANSTLFGALALQPDGTIFVAGNFTTFNGITRASLAKLNMDGSLNSGFAPVFGTASTIIELLVLPDNKILIGGSFRGVNEVFRDAVARLNPNGSTDLTFNAGVVSGGASRIQAFAVQTDGMILVGGSFTSIGGASRSNIARLNIDGSLDVLFNASASSQVNAIKVQPDGKIVLVGQFTSVNGTSGINRIARLNADGTLDTDFNPGGAGFDNIVEDAVLQTDGKIVAGGRFTAYNGTTGVNCIARVNSNGTLDTGFTTNTGAGITGAFTPQVLTLALQMDGTILAGGAFSAFNGTNSTNLVRLNTEGTRDTNFNVGAVSFDSAVDDLALQPDGRILVVGRFAGYGGTNTFSLARLNTDASLDTSFESGAALNNFLFAVGLQFGGRIIIGGALLNHDNVARVGIARLLGSGPQTQRPLSDFDGDGKADLTVWRPSDGTWYTLQSSDGAFRSVQWGQNGDLPAPGDFDGNGRTDYTVFRPSSSVWWTRFNPVLNSSATPFGISSDLPIPGDFDGDGIDDIAVWRSGVWYLQLSNGESSAYQWGLSGDRPLSGDFDGDGRADFAIYRDGEWWIKNSWDSSITGIGFGLSSDRPVPADFDGDGRTDIAVFRPSDGVWYYLRSGSGNSFAFVQWGNSTDIPVPADYDGDGTADFAVYRGGDWYILRSSDGTSLGGHHGAAGDIPIPAAKQF